MEMIDIIINLSLVIAFLFLLLSAYFFAFAESSTIASQKVIIHHAAGEGDPRAKLVAAFKDNPRRFFGTTLIGTNICIILLSIIGAHVLLHSRLLIPLAISTIIVDVLILITAEITPKTLSLSNPTLSSLKIAKLLDITAYILSPLVWLITYLPSRVLNIDHIFHTGDDELITEDQIVHMIGLSAQQGAIESSEGERAVRVFQFANTTVEKVMTPRSDMVTFDVGDSIGTALADVNASGFSRIPVLTPDGDDSPGFFAAKDILEIYKENRLDDPVEDHLRDINFIPETKNILNLVNEFRTSGDQIALVVNEHGTITGLVTLEDLLEEITGEIYDEHDTDEPRAQWVMGKLIIPGSYPAYRLAERLDIDLPEGDYDTAAGLQLQLLGHIPYAGEIAKLGDWELVATHVVRQRITRIMARRKQPPKEAQKKFE